MKHSENIDFSKLYTTHKDNWKEQLSLIQSRIDLVEPVVVEVA